MAIGIRRARTRRQLGSRSWRRSGSRNRRGSRRRVFFHLILVTAADGANRDEGNANKKGTLKHEKLQSVVDSTRGEVTAKQPDRQEIAWRKRPRGGADLR